MTGSSSRAGVEVAILACFLTVWTTIVRDDGDGAGYFMIILAAGVGTFAVWFHPQAWRERCSGVAVM